MSDSATLRVAQYGDSGHISAEAEVWGVIFAQLETWPGVYRVQQTLCKLPLLCSNIHNGVMLSGCVFSSSRYVITSNILSGQPNMGSRLFPRVYHPQMTSCWG